MSRRKVDGLLVQEAELARFQRRLPTNSKLSTLHLRQVPWDDFCNASWANP